MYVAPSKIALKDIKEYLENNYKNIQTTYSRSGHVAWEVWYCFGDNLCNKESILLNRQLGLGGINMNKNK